MKEGMQATLDLIRGQLDKMEERLDTYVTIEDGAATAEWLSVLADVNKNLVRLLSKPQELGTIRRGPESEPVFWTIVDENEVRLNAIMDDVRKKERSLHKAVEQLPRLVRQPVNPKEPAAKDAK